MKLKLENRQIGVFAALIIATIMLFLPGQDKKKYAFNPDAIAGIIKAGKEHISPAELSQWIIQGKNDYTLVDMRTKEEYEGGHIKGARNIPLDNLLKRSTLDSEFIDGKMVVLYSNGTSHASQAWLVLNSAGIDCAVLEGGYNYWTEVILSPKAPELGAADDEVLKYQASQSVAAYFGAGTSLRKTTSTGKSDNTPPKTLVTKRKNKLKGC